MEVDWLLLGCRAVASWNMPLGSRRRTPLHRSATRTSWADSYTFAKTERPSLDSAPPAAADAVTLAEECLAAALEVASAATLLLEAVQDDRSTSPTFVPFYTPSAYSDSLY
jgi:hypothetical protein